MNHGLISLNTAPIPQNIFPMIIEKHILIPELPDLLHIKSSKKSYPSQHQMSDHEGIKHPCRQCGYQFTSKGYFAEHQKAVRKGVKYSCEQCGLQFTVKGSLAKHQRAIQEGVKHSCRQCGH